MREAVRLLQPADAGEVAALEALAREDALRHRGADVLLAGHPPVGDWAAFVGGREPVWVGLVDELVVGYLHLAVAGEVATVRQVYVRPEARELGFGDTLLAAAMAHAREHGCTALEAVALPGDRDTKNLYERAGVTARLLVMRRRLD
jgi:GNAT superfamily N-acetyltransferase